MSASLTQPAFGRLAQLAENAFEEEQYDLGVASMSQMAALGWHPTGELLRNLMAISLSSLKHPLKSQQQPWSSSNAKSHKYIERIGPSATTIIDARRLLERIGKLASFDVIFNAILPTLNDSENAKDFDQTVKRKRNRLSFERDSDEDNGTDSFFSADSRVSPIKQYSQKMLECKQIWQILALGDMMDHTGSKKRLRGTGSGSRTDQEGREGEKTLRSTSQYEREAVWRVLDVMLQAWKTSSDKNSSHLAVQFRKASGRHEANRESRITPSTNVGEAFDLIFAGTAPTPIYHSNKPSESAKAKLDEKLQRRDSAIALLVEMFRLVRSGHLDEKAMLRGTSELLDNSDTLTASALCHTLREKGFHMEIAEAIKICLESTPQDEDILVDDKDDYYNSFTARLDVICQMKTLPKELKAFLSPMVNSTCVYSMPRDDVEKAMVEHFVPHDRAEISSLKKNSKIKALLSGSWTVNPQVVENTVRSKTNTANLTWEQLSFAAAWRRATLQAKRDRFHLKVEIGKSLQHMQQFIKVDVSLDKKFKKAFFAFRSELIKLGEKQQMIMKSCYEEMQRSYQQKKEDNFSSNEDEDNDMRRKMDWKQEMHRHLIACLAICGDLATEIMMLESLSQLLAEEEDTNSEVE